MVPGGAGVEAVEPEGVPLLTGDALDEADADLIRRVRRVAKGKSERPVKRSRKQRGFERRLQARREAGR